MKVYIHRATKGDARAELEEILSGIECEIVGELLEIDSEFPPPPDEDDQEMPDDDIELPVCVVVLEPGLVEEDLEPELGNAVARGCRVVGIWGGGADGDATPLGDYGSDTVAWEPGSIRDAVCGKPKHQAPDGEDAASPKRKHGGC